MSLRGRAGREVGRASRNEGKVHAETGPGAVLGLDARDGSEPRAGLAKRGEPDASPRGRRGFAAGREPGGEERVEQLGAEALAKLEGGSSPALIVLDIHMPIMGRFWSFCRVSERNSLTPCLPSSCSRQRDSRSSCSRQRIWAPRGGSSNRFEPPRLSPRLSSLRRARSRRHAGPVGTTGRSAIGTMGVHRTSSADAFWVPAGNSSHGKIGCARPGLVAEHSYHARPMNR